MLLTPNRGFAMIRTSFISGRAAMRAACVLPVAAAMLLAGCVTSGYSYREDRGGGYYYGRPSVEYRDASYPYGAYGPYDYYGPYGPYRYAYPTPYGYSYYGYGGYGYPYRYVPRTRTVDPTPDRPRSPWRNLDELRRRGHTQLPQSRPMPRPPTVTPRPPSVTPVTPSARSGMGDRIQRARERGKRTP
jgi:hypothetical protein